MEDVLRRHSTQGMWWGHPGAGAIQVRLPLQMHADGAIKMRAIAEEAGALVRQYKGAFSGEHGDGLVRSEWVSWQFGQKITRAFERVKDAFDPGNRMNPGKIVRATKMDDARLFRYGPGYGAAPLQTGLDWSAWNVQADPLTERTTEPGTGGDPAGGFAKAVEMIDHGHLVRQAAVESPEADGPQPPDGVAEILRGDLHVHVPPG
jgi:hypothetical protein